MSACSLFAYAALRSLLTFAPLRRPLSIIHCRELAQDETLKNESWDRFLPVFKKKNVSRKKLSAEQQDAIHARDARRQSTPFPPAPTPRLIDQQIESGEYFLTQQEKKHKDEKEKKEAGAIKVAQKKSEREKSFVAPDEDSFEQRLQNIKDGNIQQAAETSKKAIRAKEKRKREHDEQYSHHHDHSEPSNSMPSSSSSIDSLKNKFKTQNVCPCTRLIFFSFFNTRFFVLIFYIMLFSCLVSRLS